MPRLNKSNNDNATPTKPITIESASGNYHATPGKWGCGVGYRVWTKAAARSPHGNSRPIADVWTADQAQVLLDALDARDESVANSNELMKAQLRNQRLELQLERAERWSLTRLFPFIESIVTKHS